jgi:hypothetical protein
MKFSELVKKWEDGWRGIAIDSDDVEFDFTGTYADRIDFLVNEEWTIKEEEKKYEPINITINAVINSDSIKDVEKIINELQEKLSNLKINLSLN